MRTSFMLLTDNFGYPPVSVIVKLQWVFAMSFEYRRWSCAVGFLGASHGYWTEQPLGEHITLYDDNDRKLGWTLGMDIDWIGYPFSGMKGESGKFFHDTHKGGIMGFSSTWTLMTV